MSVGLRLTLADYDRMVADGAFDALRDRRIELIYGELCEMPLPEPVHCAVNSRLGRWSVHNTNKDNAVIRIHDPIGIPELDSAPQPDVVWARPKDYSKQHPRPRDILLLIEVADSSLDFDVGDKAELYAQAGVKDYWVVDLSGFAIEVFRSPKRGRYTDRKSAAIGEELRPLAFPKVKLSVSGLFSGTL
jgi:Uma2 family endonuclease